MSTDCNINNNPSQPIVKNQSDYKPLHRFQPGNTYHLTRQKKQAETTVRYRDSMLAAFQKSGGFARVVEICNKSQKAFILLFKELNKYLLPKSVEIDISKTESKLVLISSTDKQPNTTQVIDTTPVKQIDDNSSLDTVSNAVVDGSKDTGQL